MKRRVVGLVVLLCLTTIVHANKQTGYLLEMLETAYEQGNYKIGLNRIADLLPKVKKNEAPNSPVLTEIVAWEAMMHGQLSDFDQYQSFRQNAEASLSNTDTDHPNYFHAVLTVAKCQVFYGDYLVALETLKSVPDSLQDNEEAQFLINSILFKQGYYNRVETNISKVTSLKSATNRWQAEEILLLAETYLYNGKPSDAKALIKRSKAWVNKEFAYKFGLKARLLLLEGKIQYHQNDKKKAEKSFTKAQAAGLKYYNNAAPYYAELLKYRLQNLYELGKKSEANYWLNNQDIKLLSYYGKKSLPFLCHSLNKIKRELIFGQYGYALEDLHDFQEDRKAYPTDFIAQLHFDEVLSEVYVSNHQFKNADNLLRSDLELAKSKYGLHAPNYHWLELMHARYLLAYSNDFLDYADDNLSLIKELTDEVAETHPKWQEATLELADLYLLSEQYDKAINILNEGLSTKAKVNSHWKGENLSRQALVLAHLYEFEKAFTKIDQAIEIQEKNDSTQNVLSLARAYSIKGAMLLKFGNIHEARHYIDLSKNMSRKEEFDPFYTRVIADFNLRIHDGKYNKSEKQILALLDKLENEVEPGHWSLHLFENLLAQIYTKTGSFVDAEARLDKSKSVITTVFREESEHYSELLQLYRELKNNIGDYPEALKFSNRSVEILSAKFGDDHLILGLPLSHLALSKAYVDYHNKRSKAHQEEAIATMAQAEKLIRNKVGEHSILFAEVLENKGLLYLLYGDLNAAQNTITKALGVWQETLGNNNIHTAELEFVLGEVNHRLGEANLALKYYEDSRSAYKSIFNDENPNYVEATGMCARMNYILGNKNEAVKLSDEATDKSLVYLQSIFPNLSERGKAQYWKKVKTHFEFYNTLAFTSNDRNDKMVEKVFNINLQTKAILLNSSVKIKNEIIASGDTSVINAYNRWTELKETWVSAIGLSNEELRQEGIFLPDLEGEIEDAEKFLSQQSQAFASGQNDQEAYKWEDLKPVLGNDEQIIEVIAFRLYEEDFSDSIWYAAMSVSHKTKNAPSYTIIKNGNELHDRSIKFYRNSIRFNQQDHVSYEKFWQPIESLVEVEGTIYLSYDGVYNRLNLETILLPNGKHVLESYDVALVGTARDLLSIKKKSLSAKAAHTALFVGNPDFYSANYDNVRHWSQLEGTEKEINFLNKFLSERNWRTQALSHAQASEEMLKSIQSPGVLHIATHGFYVGEKKGDNLEDLIGGRDPSNPLLRSGIMLRNGGEIYEGADVHEFNRQDGILTAYEAMNLQLDKTDLVVLSACETGLGEVEFGEGVFGLQRSFVVAGANTIILSLFKVNDEVTTELMSAFYANWISSGDKRSAFVDAKKEIMAKYDKPIYWGAFVMIGTD